MAGHGRAEQKSPNQATGGHPPLQLSCCYRRAVPPALVGSPQQPGGFHLPGPRSDPSTTTQIPSSLPDPRLRPPQTEASLSPTSTHPPHLPTLQTGKPRQRMSKRKTPPSTSAQATPSGESVPPHGVRQMELVTPAPNHSLDLFLPFPGSCGSCCSFQRFLLHFA